MIYEYQDVQTGARHEVHASMKSPPAEEIRIDGRKCRRVYNLPAVVVKDFAVKPCGRSKLPLARMLPTKHDGVVRVEHTDAGVVRHHDDGTKTNARGFRVIDGKASYDLAKRTCNATEE